MHEDEAIFAVRAPPASSTPAPSSKPTPFANQGHPTPKDSEGQEKGGAKKGGKSKGKSTGGGGDRAGVGKSPDRPMPCNHKVRCPIRVLLCPRRGTCKRRP